MPQNIQLYPPITRSNGRTLIDGIDLEQLADRFGTPLFVTSEDRLKENFRILDNAFRKNFKNFEIKYAIKANSNPHIISTLSNLGAGADVSNMNELRLAIAGGVPKNKIMLTSNNLKQAEIDEISEQGILVNFDDLSQLERMKPNIPDIISFRFNPGTGHGYFPGITTGGRETKFGILENEIFESYMKAKEMGITRFGLHYMEGSGILDPEIFGRTFSKVLDVAVRIQDRVGIKFEFIDCGGGFGVPYKPDEKPLDVFMISNLLKEEFERLNSKMDTDHLKLIVEPGRYLVADSTVLLGVVTNVKKSNSLFVGTDIGMNTLLRPALYGAYHEIMILNRASSGDTENCTVVGPVCETSDIIGKDRRLPHPEVGDLIAVFNAGAYGYSMSSQYNGNTRAPEIMVSNGRVRMIRRRETFEDLLSTVPDM